MFERIEARSQRLFALAMAVAALAIAIRSANVEVERVFVTEDAPAARVEAAADRGDRIPLRWQPAFARFDAIDRANPPAPGGVVFVGSSSIDSWADLPSQFPSQRVVQRGLSGATMADVVRHADRLVLAYRPHTVVVYAGDNDLAMGLTPERVFDDYLALIDRVRRESPSTRVLFVSIKPSPARAGLLSQIRRTNELVAAHARGDPRLGYVDVFSPMLDDEARARRELFVADGLHLNAQGYALWRQAIVAQLR